MLRYFIIYKPFEVLSQFSREGDKKTLKDLFQLPSDVYPVGRLDYDSEGLLLLTNDKRINQALLQPVSGHERCYLVQVEGEITREALQQLRDGVVINVNGTMYQTKPCKAELETSEPQLPERFPPIRFRKHIPVSWIKLYLQEGKNRQVRKMTAKVGFPTLRLVRYSIGKLNAGGMSSGEIIELDQETVFRALFGANKIPLPAVEQPVKPKQGKRHRKG